MLKFNINDKKKLFIDIKKYFEGTIPKNNDIKKINEKVIFIFGLPRSGTTLVENIISSHNKVSPLGEINYLSKFFNINFVNDNQLTTGFINGFLNQDLQKHYFDFIKFFNIKNDLVTDKSLNLSLIHI